MVSLATFGRVQLNDSSHRRTVDINALVGALVLGADGVDGSLQIVGDNGQTAVEGVCPELVSTDSDGFKSVSYSRMTAVLVEAVKEQQQLIREQAAALGDVLRRLSAVEAR